jgi:NAD(P)-dependent dehydrogenase (short-subunit alcohol dehydrogenase family)
VQVIDAVVEKYGQIDILVNNAAEQHTVENVEDLSPEQLERTFRTNIFSQFFLVRSVTFIFEQEKLGTIVLSPKTSIALTTEVNYELHFPMDWLWMWRKLF